MLSTRQKIRIARYLSTAIVGARRLFGAGSELTAWRRGARWQLDLREVIDLALYTGLYERHLTRVAEGFIKPGAVVLDIGANIGVYTLTYAQLVGAEGRVLAFEPTRFAFDKLCENLRLNPELAKRVSAHQVFLCAGGQAGAPPALYSSWPLVDDPNLHPILRGQGMSTENSTSSALDALLNGSSRGARSLERLDFIKLDVDGHELGVLQGGAAVIERFRPVMQVEICPYLLDEEANRFDSLIELIGDLGYRLRDPATRQDVTLSKQAITRLCPQGSAVDLLALPV